MVPIIAGKRVEMFTAAESSRREKIASAESRSWEALMLAESAPVILRRPAIPTVSLGGGAAQPRVTDASLRAALGLPPPAPRR